MLVRLYDMLNVYSWFNYIVVLLLERVKKATKNGPYKNPQYFSYHKNSYFDAEVEMLKYRLPQPSSLK